MQLTNDQFALIKQQFATLKERSAFYAAKFEGIDLSDVQTQEDFEKLPFSEKDDLRNAYPLGLQAVPVWQQGDQVIYAKHLEDGSMAVGLFNRGWQTVKMNFTLRMLGLRGRQTVRDLWRQKDLTECTDKFETAVAPHGVVLVRVYPGNSREQATGK